MEKDKRYLVFTYDTYYPSGGMEDKIGSFDSIPEAIEILKNDKSDYKCLYDRMKGVEIDITLYGLEYY